MKNVFINIDLMIYLMMNAQEARFSFRKYLRQI